MKKQSFNPTARNMKGILTIALAGALLTACSPKPEKHYDIDSVASEKGTEVFQPDWTNIAQHYKFPQWFQDGKFGIFIHWGVYSVPAFGNEWYSRNMYLKDSPEYKHHIETYGKHTDFGYKDFIPLFTGDKFKCLVLQRRHGVSVRCAGHNHHALRQAVQRNSGEKRSVYR